MQRALDHIVLLVPHQKLARLPNWVTDAFTVIEGGAHAGGQTENKLIIFQDGVYIELIAFVDGLDPERRNSHRWGRRPEGHIIDWALTLLDGAADPSDDKTRREFGKIQERVEATRAGIRYDDLVDGGRTTPTGTVLKWATSTPAADDETAVPVEGGELPFWCLDRTPRLLRVPHQDKQNVTHPSGAVGVASVSILVRDADLLEKLRRVYDAIMPGRGVGVEGMETSYVWRISTPAHHAGRDTLLKVGLLCGDGADGGAPVQLELKLFTSSHAGKISGHFVDGSRIDMELEPL